MTERKKGSEKLAVVPKKSSARRQKALQAEKVCSSLIPMYMMLWFKFIFGLKIFKPG